MRLIIAYSKIKKRNLVLINNVTYQREILSDLPIPIRLPLTLLNGHWEWPGVHMDRKISFCMEITPKNAEYPVKLTPKKSK